MNSKTINKVCELLSNIQIIGNKIYTQKLDEITPESILFMSAKQDIQLSLTDAKVIMGAILNKKCLSNTKRYIKKVNHPLFGAPNTIKQVIKWKPTKKTSIETLLNDFPFADEIVKSRAIALMITPFIYYGGVTPVGIYLGNRERIGKDYLASLTRILANDTAGELHPLTNDEETRKTLLASCMANEEFAHFANNIKHMNSPSLEQGVTSRILKGRILGKSEVVNVPFNMIVTLSGNAGWSLTPDLTYRSVIVALHSNEENIMVRQFKGCPSLIAAQKREEFWNYIKYMYDIWVEKGKPKGKINQATFPEWANIIGGIMEVNGYINPLIHTEAGAITGLIDRDGQEWKRFLPMLYKVGVPCSIKEIIQIAETNEYFEFFDFTKHGYRTAFGKIVKKYCDRWFGDYRLVKIGTELIGTNTGKQLYEIEKRSE